MRKFIFTTILLFLALGQVWGATRRYYCKCAQSWWTKDGAAVGCYAWVGEDESKQENHAYPGVRMTGTGNDDEWYIDLDTKYENVVFTRVNSSGDIESWGAKTEDITLDDNNYYTINNTDACWSGEECSCDCTVSKYAPTPAIAGSMNSWRPDANVFSGSPLRLTMDLPAGKAYQFKVADGQGSAWYGRNNTYDNDLVFVGQTDAETLYSGEHNLMLMTAEAGPYTFEWDSEDHKLTITYPSAGNHPSANYYYIAKNASSTSGWNSGYFIYLNFWNGSGPLATWNTDEPRLEYATEINGENYYYVPVLADYTSFKAHANKNSGEGYSTGDQTLADHAGQYLDCVESSWGWHSFTFNVEEHNNGGRIWSDSIGSYTFGVGATLPTNITRWAYDFAGWYDNEELEGDPVTAISTTDNGDKDYYAKWTSIVQDYPIASHPEFLAAQEGDIIAVTVTGVHTSAAIYLYDLNYNEITHLSISATGTYTFPLSAAAAAGLREKGLQVTGTNFTFSDVAILYRKTIWEGEVDATGNWEQSDAISNALFAGLQAGDFLGVTVNKINENKDSWHTYAIRAAWRTNIISHNMSDPGVGVDILTEALVDSLQHKDIILVSSYLSCTAIHTYTNTRVYDVTLNTNSGTINSGDVTSYTFGTGATLPTDVTRTGYTFAGWYPDAEFAGDRVYTISTTDYGAKTYYAKWTVNTYDITLNLNDGTVNDGNVTNYTYGVGATLPTDVTKWGYKFDGWYGNSTFEGDAVTAISTSDYGDKEYWAKWTSISETMLSGSHPEFLAAEEGDILVITVANVQPSAQIFLANTSSVEIDHKSISTTGKYAFQLSASAATALHTGVIITGVNYTKSSVVLLYKKTIWSGTLTSPKDAEPWQVQSLTQSDFADIADGDYVGFTVSSINDGETWHQYSLYYYDSDNQLVKSNTQSTTGTFLEAIPDGKAAGLADDGNAVFIVAQYLTLTGFHRYLSTRDYTVTLNTNGGTVNTGDVTSYTYPEGETLPTDVTRDGYNFDGWYDNAELTGSAVTTITTSDYGDKEYWAKWTSIAQTKTPANYHRLYAAEAGDILVVDVTAISAGSSIKINKSADGSNLFTKAIAATGKYAFQLSASDATALHTGMILSGTNYTGTVELLLKNDIWTGTLVSPVEKVVWQSQSIASSKFADIEDGDYVSFTIPSIVEDSSWCQYNLYSGTGGVLTYSAKSSGAGTYIHEIPSGKASELKADGDYIAAQNLTISAFSRYITTRDYTVTLNTNSGTINAGDVTGYTYPIGATLPTDVTLDGYNFDGWYAYEELTGDPVTEITISDYGNKEYWAKWTPIAQNVSSETDKSLKIASEGDLLVINVATVGESAQIVVKNYAGDANLFTKEISATGKYAFPLSSTDATALRTGLTITGTNYTYTYQLLYRKTIWSGELESPIDKVEWQTASLTHSDLAGIADGDYVGFTVSAINTGEFHQYNLCAYKEPTTYVAANNTTNDAGTYIETIKSDFATHLLDENKSVFIAAQNLTLTDFYRYLPTRDYIVTLNTNGGTINAGNITSYTYGVGATLPTNVTLDGYNFDGWYANSSFEGDAVTTITTSDYGNKEYWAKWTPETLTYVGGSGSNWNTTANWSPACLPTIEHDVVLSVPVEVNIAHATAKSIVLDQNSKTGKLTIQPNMGLEVAGTITRTTDGSNSLATRPEDLILQSSSVGNASLVFTNSNSCQATVQMYSIGDIDGGTWNWQFMGIPFTSANALYSYYDAYLYEWKSSGWDVVPNGNSMTPFTGYCITQNDPTTYVMEGTLTPNNDVAISIPAGKEFVMANSWSAPISVCNFTETTLPLDDQTIYLFNTGHAESAASEGEAAGTYIAMPINSAVYTGNYLIAPMEGFYVDNTSGSAATITLKYDELVRPSGKHTDIVAGPMHAPKRIAAEADPAVIKIKATGSRYSDRVVILAREDFSTGFDNGWDGKNINEPGVAPIIYALRADGTKDAVSAIPTYEGTVVGFRKGEDYQYTFSFEYDGDEMLYLNDLKEKTSTLIDAEHEYTFTTATDDAEARFTVSASPIANMPTGFENGANDTNGANSVRKVMINDVLYIIRDGRMYNAIGLMIK